MAQHLSTEARQDIWLDTYMNWVERLLHVVGGKDIGRPAKLVEQTILESKHRRRSDNGSFREDLANDLFATSFASEEL